MRQISCLLASFSLVRLCNAGTIEIVYVMSVSEWYGKAGLESRVEVRFSTIL